MRKNFESTLPDGYSAVFEIDAKNTVLSVVLNLVAVAVSIAIIAAAAFIIRPTSDPEGFSLTKSVIFIILMIIYIILHELVHGAAYKLLTHQKLKFGLSFSVAYCGMPDIYVYRTPAMIALLAPFVVFLFGFGIPIFLFSSLWDKMFAAVLLAIHIGGCSGDLYDTIIYLFKLRNPQTLMRDTGPKQTFYLRQITPETQIMLH